MIKWLYHAIPTFVFCVGTMCLYPAWSKHWWGLNIMWVAYTLYQEMPNEYKN
jgi:hypothetical protein